MEEEEGSCTTEREDILTTGPRYTGSIFFNEEMINFIGRSNNVKPKNAPRICIFSKKITYILSQFLFSVFFFSFSPLYGEILSEHLLSN